MQGSEEEYRRKVESYGDADLRDILSSIDREKHPERHAIVEAEIALRKADPERGVRRSEADASTSDSNAPSGIGGWLILPFIGLIVAPFVWGFLFFLYLRLALLPQAAAIFGNVNSPQYFPGWAWFVSSVTTVSLAMLALTIWVLVEFIRKKRRVPGLMILVLVLNVLAMLAFHLSMRQAPPILASAAAQSIQGVAQTVLAAGIWIPYFLKSKRVANTFVK